MQIRPQTGRRPRVAIGVNDGRNSGDNELFGGPSAIRDHLYRLTLTLGGQLFEFRDIKTSFTEDETEIVLIAVVSELIQMGIIPIVLGGKT